MNLVRLSLTTSLLFLVFRFSISGDTITPTFPIKDGDTLVSSGQNFELGFFGPGKSTRRYVGIWYHRVTERTVVWVANRENPVDHNDSSAVLAISNQGNMVLYGKNLTLPLWSTNVSAPSTNNCVAQLLDSGNLVLVEQDSKRILWQSFDYPTDTLLPYMKLGLNLKTGSNWDLSSWRSQDDPGAGTISYKIDPSGFPQLFLYRDGKPVWRGGPWTGQRWSGVPEMTRSYIFNVSYVNNKSEVSILYGIKNASIMSRMVVDESGFVQRSSWNYRDRRWIGFWSAPKEDCDYYRQCGPNSNCDPYEAGNFICKCLSGFEPKSPEEWYLRDGSGGCIRKLGGSTCLSGEGFVKVARVKMPDTSAARADMGLSLEECEEECLKNCSCTAYASADERGIGCLRMYGDLVDMRTYSDVGQDIYIRVDGAELAKYRNRKSTSPLAKKGILAAVIVAIAVALCLILLLLLWFTKKKRQVSAGDRESKLWSTFTSPQPFSLMGGSPVGRGLEETSSDVPLFDLAVIVAATNRFSDDNKLGEGGFGSVYKGLLGDGKEIAVKRLSQNSGQGNNEFKNEVALIARLQHRNLVRILGCCMDKRERMLIYEYLPNKSLDSFIFDETKKSLLDWPTRYNIIGGIARGILYLHQDSRLKIVHRDLKASNVLLDETMTPKISDFGMARIFGVDQNEANTNRVVGTYGYMSPEYAMQGLFSVKSDVYSFGVLLLEVITGRKNSTFYQQSDSTHLVGHVWDMWNQGRALEIVDLSLGDSYLDHQVLRCIEIGLLCVQESATDRPTMSSVVSMLTNETALPSPNKPAFILKTSYTSGDPSTSGGANSVNDMTATTLQAR